MMYTIGLQLNIERPIGEHDPHKRVPSSNLPDSKRWNRQNQILELPDTTLKMVVPNWPTWTIHEAASRAPQPQSSFLHCIWPL